MVSLKSFFLFVFIGLFGGLYSQQTENDDSLVSITSTFIQKGSSSEHSKSWKFSSIDNPNALLKNFNDSSWINISSVLNANDIKRVNFNGFGIFRYTLVINEKDRLIPKVIFITQKGASEIYINGKLEKTYGVVSKEDINEVPISDKLDPIYLKPEPDGVYQIAIRYSNTNWKNSYNGVGGLEGGFRMCVDDSEDYVINLIEDQISKSEYGLGFFVFFSAIGLIHFLLFIFYRVRRSNLFFSIFCFILSYFFLFYYVDRYVVDVRINDLLKLFVFVIAVFFFVSILSVLYSFFYDKLPKFFYYVLSYAVFVIVITFINRIIGGFAGLILILVSVFEAIRIIIVALRKKKKGALLITFGFSLFILFFVICFVIAFSTGQLQFNTKESYSQFLNVVLFVGIICIPLSMSIFLAWDFGMTNKTLTKKLVEVEELSAKTIEQEKERRKILAEQNVMLEVQVKERTAEINEQKKIIEEKNKDITDSINYAQRIQRSILPTEKEIVDIFPNTFVLFKPRDIVSGDFYQFKKAGDYKYAILADCTGHGVPGALMSMIGSNLLHQIIIEKQIKEPNSILSALHKEVKSTLRQTSEVQSHDGMDASVVLLKDNKIYIASANRPVYIVTDGVLNELKPDKRSIGGSQSMDDVVFNVTEMDVVPNMIIYLFSDGYADQFGGEAGKKFKVKNLSELLVSIHAKPLEVQKEILNITFDNWKKQLEQVDDVSLIGIRF